MIAHLTSQSTYTALTAGLAILLGALPVGLGAYPIGAALAISTLVLAASPHIARAWSRRCGRRGKAAPKELPEQSQEPGASVQWRRAE